MNTIHPTTNYKYRPYVAPQKNAVDQFLGATMPEIDSNIATIQGIGSTATTNFFTGGVIEVPSLHLTTPRGHDITIVDATFMHPKLEDLHREGTEAYPPEKILGAVTSMATRIADVQGQANGLHHLHSSQTAIDTGRLGTIYYPTARNVLTPRPYIGRVPVTGSGAEEIMLAHIASIPNTPKQQKRLTSVLRS